MSIFAGDQMTMRETTVTALRGSSTIIEVMPSELVGLRKKRASIWLLNMYGTPLTWLNTPYGAAYVERDHIVFNAESYGDVDLEFRIEYSDSATKDGRITVRSR